MTLTAVTRNCG